MFMGKYGNLTIIFKEESLYFFHKGADRHAYSYV